MGTRAGVDDVPGEILVSRLFLDLFFCIAVIVLRTYGFKDRYGLAADLSYSLRPEYAIVSPEPDKS